MNQLLDWSLEPFGWKSCWKNQDFWRRLQLCGGSSKSGEESGDSIAWRLRPDCGRQERYFHINILFLISSLIWWLLIFSYFANVELSNRANRIQPLPGIELRSQLTRLCFSACGSLLFAGSESGSIVCWSTVTNKKGNGSRKHKKSVD